MNYRSALHSGVYVLRNPKCYRFRGLFLEKIKKDEGEPFLTSFFKYWRKELKP